MECFEIYSKEVILYGAATIGKLMYELFTKNGIKVVGFIDKRASEINTFMNLPVWNIGDEDLEAMKTDDYYIFISVKNVFEHTYVANLLFQYGFHNLIYRPSTVLSGGGTAAQIEINQTYDLIERNEFLKIKQIPKTLGLDIYIPTDSSLILEEKNSVIVNVSIDSVYTDNGKKKKAWCNKNIITLLPHIELFRFAGGNNRYGTQRYIEFCESAASSMEDVIITDAWRRNVLKNRIDVFEHMNHFMELEPDFFIKNAPNANWNKQGYFNLNSGKHRAAFFASKMKKYMPLRISKGDYKNWLNENGVDMVQTIINNQMITDLEGPIPHPFYYKYPCTSREFYYTFIYYLNEYLANYVLSIQNNLDFSKLNVFCMLNDLGFVERLLKKMSCKVKCVYNEKSKKLICAIDQLLFCSCDTEQMCNEYLAFYDVAIIDLDRESLDVLLTNIQVALIFVIADVVISNDILCGYSLTRLFSSIVGGQNRNVYVLTRQQESCEVE